MYLLTCVLKILFSKRFDKSSEVRYQKLREKVFAERKTVSGILIKTAAATAASNIVSSLLLPLHCLILGLYKLFARLASWFSV